MNTIEVALTTELPMDVEYLVYDDIEQSDAIAKYVARYGVAPKTCYRWAWYWYFPIPADNELPLFQEARK